MTIFLKIYVTFSVADPPKNGTVNDYFPWVISTSNYGPVKREGDEYTVHGKSLLRQTTSVMKPF